MNEWDFALQTLKLHGKWIFIGGLLGILIAFVLILALPKKWQATMIIAPSERTAMPSLSSFLPQGAADAPALQYFVERIDSAQSTDFTVFETLLFSPSLFQDLRSNNPSLFPNVNIEKQQKWFKNNLKIRSVGLTQLKNVSFRHTDKNKAKIILNSAFDLADRQLRQAKKIKTQRRITYLSEQLKVVTHPDHRDAIISLLKEQEQIAMMTSIDTHYAADMIEPPSIEPNHASPNATLLFPVCLIMGVFIGFMGSSLRQAIIKL